MNIYEISESLLNLEEAMENCSNEEEVKEIIAKSIEEMSGTLKDKVDNSVRFIRSREAEIKALSEEIKFLQAKKKSLENKVESFKDYLFQFTKLQAGEVKGNVFRLKVRNNPVSVKILDESLVDEIFVNYKRVIDTTSLKEALKSGAEIKGAELVRNESLSIK